MAGNTSGETSAAAQGAEGGGATGPSEDVKQRFREALERKEHRRTDGVGGSATGSDGGVHDAHGPAHVQRQFRRKSG